MIEKPKHKILPSNLEYPLFQPICKENFQRFFVHEYKFLSDRLFKADFALPCCKLLIEIQGGAFSKGKGHKSVTNYLNDIDKLNSLNCAGFHVLWFTPQMIGDMSYLTILRQWFYNNKCSHIAENIALEMLASE